MIIFTFVSMLLLLCRDASNHVSGDSVENLVSTNLDQINYCGSRNSQSRLKKIISRTPNPGNFIFVNTIDGQVHAFSLDCNNVIKHKWSFDLDGGQFEHNLSSIKFGDHILIPSLKGSLYSFDGKSLYHVKLPHQVDSSNPSFFSVAGGIMTNMYGLELSSGKLIYKCLNGQCSSIKFQKFYQDSIIVKQDKHIYNYLNSITGHSHIKINVSDIAISQTFKNSNLLSENHLPLTNLRIHIAEGVLNMVDENNFITFQHTFNAPIVNIWQLSANDIRIVPLFSAPMNPSIDKSMSSKPFFKYIGVYNNALYINESNDSMQEHSKNILFNRDYHNPFYEFINDVQLSIPKNFSNLTEKLNSPKSGFYIGFNNEKESNSIIQYPQIGHELQIPIKSTKRDTLLSFWKEIFLICTITSIIFHVSLCRLKNKSQDRQSDKNLPSSNAYFSEHFKDISSENLKLNGDLYTHQSPNSDINLMEEEFKIDTKQSDYGFEKNFQSRFFTEFHYISMLGRGGFGHVHKCQHVLDNREYAIKQINLPYKKISQKKIMREVHALANLEHTNILRYYHSWIEFPPKTWYINKMRDIFTNDSPDCLDSEDIEALFNPSVKLMQSIPNDDAICVGECDANNDFEEKSDPDVFVQFHDTNVNGRNNITTNKDKSQIEELNYLNSHINFTPDRFCILYIQVELCINKSLDYWLMFEKEDLIKRFPNNPLKDRDTKHTLNVYLQLANAILYVHQQGLMHRDLKPANIFFNKDNVLKLGDFGLAAFKNGCPTNLSKAVINKLMTNPSTSTDVGTILYMSPEILHSKPYSQKIDIYSMAIILFEMFEDISSYNEKVDKLYRLKRLQFPSTFSVKHPKICHMIKFMMISNAKKRWNAVKVLEALNQYKSELEK